MNMIYSWVAILTLFYTSVVAQPSVSTLLTKKAVGNVHYVLA